MTPEEKLYYDARARVFKALAHPTRLWIAERLAVEECSVYSLVEPLGADFSTVSRHLSVLKEAGLVIDEKRGKQVFYRLRVPCILNFMNCVEDVIKNRIREQSGWVEKRG
ncbi:MAG: helix-turn-helix transcriptional regulator [Deltaproteobacteria bacterium]|nr:helix-turn-helix transcriptional regulator [Deltaproteobacteria bacterium]